MLSVFSFHLPLILSSVFSTYGNNTVMKCFSAKYERSTSVLTLPSHTSHEPLYLQPVIKLGNVTKTKGYRIVYTPCRQSEEMFYRISGNDINYFFLTVSGLYAAKIYSKFVATLSFAIELSRITK